MVISRRSPENVDGPAWMRACSCPPCSTRGRKELVVCGKRCYSFGPQFQEGEMSVPNPFAAITSAPRPSPELVFVNGSDQRKIAVDHVPFPIGAKPKKDLMVTDTRVSTHPASIQNE